MNGWGWMFSYQCCTGVAARTASTGQTRSQPRRCAAQHFGFGIEDRKVENPRHHSRRWASQAITAIDGPAMNGSQESLVCICHGHDRSFARPARHVCLHKSLHTRLHMCAYACLYTCPHTKSTHMPTYTAVHMSVTHVCMGACTRLYTCLHKYLCVFAHLVPSQIGLFDFGKSDSRTQVGPHGSKQISEFRK